jgi:thiamine pyrophosphate-dependent acetolactate synthase large subunit-like protein
MKTVNAIAYILQREGVDFLIGYPRNPIIEAAAEADIRPIVVRQERTGLHMAEAVSRVTSGRRLGVFAMQQGPGTENAFGGVSQAFGDSAPILVLPAGYARHLNIPPNFNAFLNFQHVTKWVEQASTAPAVPDIMRRAFTQLRNGRPRPVLVEFPVDVLGEEIAEPAGYRPARRTRCGPDPQDVAEAAAVLVGARRPVIYAGQGVHYAQAWQSLRELAELLEAPVTTSLPGKSAFPEDHPLSLGASGNTRARPVVDFLENADVIFGVGCSFAPTPFDVVIPKGKVVVHATSDPSDFNVNVEVDHPLVGDAALTLEALLAEVRERVGGKPRGRRPEVAGEIKAAKESWLGQWLPRLTSDQRPIDPYRVIWDLLHTVDVPNTIITHDAGSPRSQLVPWWQTRAPLSFIGWSKTTQLGSGLGFAMGAKLAHPDKLCINVWGDAAIGFTGMDFETAVRERLPILSVLLNNASMAAELDVMPAATAKYRSTDISGNYAGLAQDLGGYAERVTEPGDIVPAIRRAVEQTWEGRPALLEFITAQ